MNFLFPTFLYALSLAAIPVIIHFFNFQRSRKVYFTNVAFLASVKSVTNARNRLRNILVMLARILFITFLVLAFARPFIPNENASSIAESNYVSIYFDNSYSLQNEVDNRRLFDVGVKHVEDIVGIFPQNTLYQLLDNSFEGNMSYFYERDKLEEKLIEVGFSNLGRSISNALGRQKNALENVGAGEGNHIFLISDFQKSSVGNLADLALDTLNNYYLVPLVPNSNTNLFIDSVWLDNPFIKEQENNVVNVRVTNYGDQPVDDKGVKLFIDGKQVSSSTIDIPAGSMETVGLNFAVTEPGEKACKVVVEDFPVNFDNEYFFVMKVAPRIRIVIVSGSRQSYLQSVFETESFFDYQYFDIGALDYSQLSTADLIILENLPTIDNALLTSLQRALDGGSTLAVFPHQTSEPSSYTALAGFPINFNRLSVSVVTDEARMTLRVPDEQDPFFEGVFEKTSANMSMPTAFPVANWNPVGRTLLRFRNEAPFLSLLDRGDEGKIYLFATTLNMGFTNFPKHAMFVPTMYKIALSSKVKNDRLAWSFSEQLATISLDSIKKNDIFQLVSEQYKLIPAQRVLESKLLINIPKTDMEAGNFTLQKANTQETFGHIAFNYDNTESKLDYYSVEELGQLFGGFKNVQIFDAADEDRFVKEFSNKNISTPLWRYALMLALFFLLVEVLLIRFWKTA